MDDIYSYSEPGKKDKDTQPARQPRQNPQRPAGQRPNGNRPANPRGARPQSNGRRPDGPPPRGPQVDGPPPRGSRPNDPVPRRKKKKRHTGRNIFLSLLLVIALLAGGAYALAHHLIQQLDIPDVEPRKNEHIKSSALMKDSNVLNILLIGMDRRKAEGDAYTRADTNMLVSLDKNSKSIKLVSFQRDTWVDIPGEFAAKLNAACTYGGPNLVMNTIEYNFHVKLDNYVLMDFAMFRSVIDSLGGIEVDVTEAEAAAIRKQGKIDIEAGKNVHMDGNTALWFSRIRKLDTDFMRTSRQRMVVNAVIKKVKDTNPIELYKLIQEILPQIETNLTESDIIRLGLNGLSYLQYDIKEAQIPKEGLYESRTIQGQDALDPDLEANREYLKAFLYDNTVSQEDETS